MSMKTMTYKTSSVTSGLLSEHFYIDLIIEFHYFYAGRRW